MADRETLLALAARVEQAQGPDREIELAIFRLLNPQYAGPEWKPYAGGLRHVNDGSDARTPPDPRTAAPRWTASLDAALTLVPEGWRWAVHGGPWTRGPHATLLAPTYVSKSDQTADAATPALALIAAALRARAEEV